MRMHYIMHAPFEEPGAIETWALKNGHALTGTHIYQHEKLPNVTAFDLLVVMGGPQSPLACDKYPYLLDEIALIQDALHHEKGIIGICLGAQLIGESLGAKTLPSPHKEVGMYPIQLTQDAMKDPIFSQFPQTFPVMHWHNDMPGMPEGSILLAKSEGCPHQAFRYCDKVYGLQFHLEPTQHMIQEMIKNCPNDLQPSQFTQTAAELLRSDFDGIHQKMDVILTSMVDILRFN